MAKPTTLRLYCKITITKYNFSTKVEGESIVFDFVNNVEVSESIEDLTQTAKITIPRKLKFDGKPIASTINSIFNWGDKVKIELGYFPNLRTVFTGYISNISINAPIEIEFQDEMFLLKQKKILFPVKFNTVTRGKKGRKLKTPKIVETKIPLRKLLSDVLLEGTGIQFRLLTEVDINVKRFDSSAATVLDKLKDVYGLYSYFVDGILHVGLASDASRTTKVPFVFEEVIIDDTNLKYQRLEDVRLRVRAESINTRTNARIELFVGDPDGAVKDFKILNASKSELEKFAKSKLSERKYEGYRGEFLTFGENYVRPGDIASLTSKQYPEKNGNYLVVSVKRMFGIEGYRQLVELGQRVSF